MLVVVDTLRADRLGVYGHERETSPRIRSLARSGVLFRNCLATSPWTGPSVASVLTGRYPDELGMRSLHDPLPADATTLAERLGAAGYQTGAVVSNAIAGPAYGFDAGYREFRFERYKGGKGTSPRKAAGRPVFTADRVTDQALDWMRRAEPPFLLHVHYTDPHAPYLAPPRWRPRSSGRPALPERLLLGHRFAKLDLDGVQLDAVERAYEAEISFVDHEIGRLLDAAPRGAVVALVADHGEEFLEHGGFLHGHTLHQELLHVPLVIRGPGVPAGVVVDAPISLVDVTPTLLDLVGLPHDGTSGRSLRASWAAGAGREAEGEPRALFSILDRDGRHCRAVRRGRWKLIRCREEDRVALYDLERDPGEQRDVAPDRAEPAHTLGELLDAREEGLRAAHPPTDPKGQENRERELRALGYL